MIALLTIFVQTSIAASTFVLSRSITSDNFLTEFEFFSDPDPSRGNVAYQPKNAAIAKKLVQFPNGQIFLGVDNTTILPANQTNRDAIRAEGLTKFDAGLFIIDAEHMPIGCATWPAFWLLGERQWPQDGEVDIIEGVNENTENAMTLHTAAGCDFRNVTFQEGGTTGTNRNCLSLGEGNAGCGTSMRKTNSFGRGFNQQKGGVYATLWDDTGIRIWFFTRSQIPADISSGNPDPSTWGLPDMNRPFGSHCDKQRFRRMKMIVSTDLCGDWAGVVYNLEGQCPGNCRDFVRNNPGAFTNAFWTINSIKVYQGNGSNTQGLASSIAAAIPSVSAAPLTGLVPTSPLPTQYQVGYPSPMQQPQAQPQVGYPSPMQQEEAQAQNTQNNPSCHR